MEDMSMKLTKWDPWKQFEKMPFFALTPPSKTDFAVDVLEEKGNIAADIDLFENDGCI